MKVVVAGSRTITDYELVKYHIEKCKFDITEIVSGTADGADKLGEKWAAENNIPIKRFPADWQKYGSSAGPIRNRQMGEYCDAGVVIIDKTVESRGSKNMVSILDELNKPRYVVYIDQERDRVGFISAEHQYMLAKFCTVEVGEGWKPLVNQAIDCCHWLNERKDLDLRIEFLQVKEKFGGLRIYFTVDGKGNDFYDENFVHGYISALETISTSICEICGCPGKRRKGPWIQTLCDEHAKAKEK